MGPRIRCRVLRSDLIKIGVCSRWVAGSPGASVMGEAFSTVLMHDILRRMSRGHLVPEDPCRTRYVPMPLHIPYVYAVMLTD